MKRATRVLGTSPWWRRLVLAGFAGLAFALSPALSASAADGIEPAADTILKGMTDQLKGLTSFSAEYDVDNEIITKSGQKLQFSASGKIAAERGKGFMITRQGPYADVQVTFDGKVISLYGKGLKAYAQLESPGPTFEEAVEEFHAATGLDAPGADLLASDPYTRLTDGVTEGHVVGTAYVGGEKCDHLAFRNDDVDWQVWISTGEQKLPIKYVITTKWVTGAPQYTLHLRNWNKGEVDAKLFSFEPPADAKKLEQVSADATGEIHLEDVK
jgi:hypothetical protein